MRPILYLFGPLPLTIAAIFDIYLFDTPGCHGTGIVCEGVSVGYCCHYSDPYTLASSIEFAKAGAIPGSRNPKGHDIQAYSQSRGNYCGREVTRDRRCASHSYGYAFTGGSVVTDRERTPRKRNPTPNTHSDHSEASSSSSSRSAYFYLEGSTLYTIAENSPFAAELHRLGKDEAKREEFLKRHGVKKVLN